MKQATLVRNILLLSFITFLLFKIAGAVFDGLSQRIEEEVPRPSRRELEREAAIGMLSVRVTEMKVAWKKNK